MISAVATGAKGERIIFIGLTHKNLARLIDGQDIWIKSEYQPGFPEDIKIVITCGLDERAITEKLKPLIDPEKTKIVMVPQKKGSVS